MIEYDLLVLAGGEGERMGRVSKAEVQVAGRAMLDRVLDAADTARCSVVVGPGRLARPGVPAVLEDPPLGGPVAGLAAGLAALGPAGDIPVVVLACDAPRAARAVPLLLDALARDPGADVAWLIDAEGRAQRLVAAYRRAALRDAVDALGDAGGVHGASVGRLTGALRHVDVADPDALGDDVDTWQAAEQIAALIEAEET
ncbi:MAG: NTP transferase domain-containing protein [Actinomycetales bacterium]|nr:NTP transferase domain-containing protein [Actinomycetales bacterium]